ncbi:hypothetical protein C1I59_14935 [Paenibacillus polymyxa]|nr:hypothetical protein C1I59_14935 [Paenibacillus polymyxa]
MKRIQNPFDFIVKIPPTGAYYLSKWIGTNLVKVHMLFLITMSFYHEKIYAFRKEIQPHE